jgi:hypothetical protein
VHTYFSNNKLRHLDCPTRSPFGLLASAQTILGQARTELANLAGHSAKNSPSKVWAESVGLRGGTVKTSLVRMICMSALRQSVMVGRQLNLLSSGKGLMKSITTESLCPSGTGRGCSGPVGPIVHLCSICNQNSSVHRPFSNPCAYLASNKNFTMNHMISQTQNDPRSHVPVRTMTPRQGQLMELPAGH